MLSKCYEVIVSQKAMKMRIQKHIRTQLDRYSVYKGKHPADGAALLIFSVIFGYLKNFSKIISNY